MFPLVFHKQIQSTVAVPAAHTLVIYLMTPAGRTVVQSSSVITSDNVSAGFVGAHDACLFNSLGQLVESGRLYIGAGATTEQSQAAATLDAIDAVLTGKATDDIQSYTVAGRSVAKMSTADLLRLRSRYAEIVARERAATAGTAAPFFTTIVIK